MKRLMIASMLASSLWLVPVYADTTPQQQISSRYSSWLGGLTNTQQVTNALRQGGTATLTNPDGSTATVSVSRGMGWGNVNLALASAQYSLQQQGIGNPTAGQLASALNGVLGQRASGMGWGQIAQKMGTTVGALRGRGAEHAQRGVERGERHDNRADDHGVGRGEGRGHGEGRGGGEGGGHGGGGNGGGHGGR